MSKLHEAAALGDLRRVRELLERGANINAKDEYGRTPLHIAAIKGYQDVAQFLIEKGANVNARDNYGWTPLHAAVFWGHLDITANLLEAGANPHLADYLGKSPADLAKEKGYDEIVELIENWIRKRSIASIIAQAKDKGYEKITGLIESRVKKKPSETTSPPVEKDLISLIETTELVQGEWGRLHIRVSFPSTLTVEGEVDWLDPGLVSGSVDIPVKPRKAGMIPIAIVAKSSGKEERKIVWVEVLETRRKAVENRCPKCGVQKEPGAKYCWLCGAKLA